MCFCNIYIILFQISDPISMTAVVGIISSGLLVFVFVVGYTGYAYRFRKNCFKDSSKTSHDDTDRSKLDARYQV